MGKYVIVTDSCSDLGKDLRDKYDLEYIPMHFTIDGIDYPADLDWQKMSAKDFYDSMRNGKRAYTAQVNPSEYLEAFEGYIKDGFDILSISCSSALSASVKASYTVRDELLAKYPDKKIICIDSLMSCAGLSMLCIRASELRKAGKTIEETAKWIEENKLTVHQFATTEKLSYLKQAGRVKAASAFFGGLLNIKPIIISDAKGQNTAVEKVKGRTTSIERIASLALENYKDVPYQRIFISHADCYDDAIKLKDAVLKKLGVDIEADISIIGPTVGASVGPGTISVYFYGKEVTLNKD